MKATLIITQRHTAALTLADPLGREGPHEVPASLGMKVEIDGKQYGWWFDEAGLEALGIDIRQIGGNPTYYGELHPLVEGNAPPVEEVPWG